MAAASLAPALAGLFKKKAPTGGGGSTFGNLLGLASVGVPAVTSLFGQRSQNRALDKQGAIEQQNYAQQLRMAQDNEAYRRQEAQRVADEERRRWTAEEGYRARQVAADEEERAFNRRLLEEREARRAPRRVASQQAMVRLGDLLKLGRR